jgi:hypothetical protein
MGCQLSNATATDTMNPATGKPEDYKIKKALRNGSKPNNNKSENNPLQVQLLHDNNNHDNETQQQQPPETTTTATTTEEAPAADCIYSQ